MKIIKKSIKNIIRSFGYEVIKPVERKKRVIYNAFYNGHNLKCFKDDPLTESILTGKGWDAQLSEIIKFTLDHKQGDIVEIGANIGASTLPIFSSFPNSKLHCIEPVPVFFSLLEQNLKSYELKNVELFNMGIGSKDNEEIEINVGLGTAGLSTMVHYQMKGKTLKLKSQTLDTFSKDKKVSLLKIDVDGHELNVLKGAKNLLKEQKPYIFMEVALKLFDQLDINPNQIFNILKNSGYTKMRLWDHADSFIKETSNWEEFLTIASDQEHYLNVLFFH